MVLTMVKALGQVRSWANVKGLSKALVLDSAVSDEDQAGRARRMADLLGKEFLATTSGLNARERNGVALIYSELREVAGDAGTDASSDGSHDQLRVIDCMSFQFLAGGGCPGFAISGDFCFLLLLILPKGGASYDFSICVFSVCALF